MNALIQKKHLQRKIIMAYCIDQSVDEWFYLAVRRKLMDGVQKTDREGRPQWSVEVLHREAGRKSEVVLVTVADHTEPEVEPMSPAQFKGLKVAPWNTDTGSGIYFTAEAVL